jgi:hypothetical protein
MWLATRARNIAGYCAAEWLPAKLMMCRYGTGEQQKQQ